MIQTHDKLYVGSLTPEQHARTCNYWYVVQSAYYPHIAFTHKHHLLQWLRDRGLELTQELPAERGVHSWQSVKGAYRTALDGDMDVFNQLQGLLTRGLQNGQYTLTIITHDDDGLRTEHKLNPNVRNRPVFDYAESRELVG